MLRDDLETLDFELDVAKQTLRRSKNKEDIYMTEKDHSNDSINDLLNDPFGERTEISTGTSDQNLESAKAPRLVDKLPAEHRKKSRTISAAN